MGTATVAGNKVKKAVQMLMNSIERAVHSVPREPAQDATVFAVTNCHPTRVAIYAAAFHGGWKVQFMRSLAEAVDAARTHKPKAVFYDHANQCSWDQYCSALAADGVPFILLAHKNCDETFLVLLAAGGYYASGNPLTSEDIVRAVDLADNVAALTPRR